MVGLATGGEPLDIENGPPRGATMLLHIIIVAHCHEFVQVYPAQKLLTHISEQFRVAKHRATSHGLVMDQEVWSSHVRQGGTQA